MISRGKQVTFAGFIAALAAIGTMAATLGMPVPKPAWRTDVLRVQGQVQDVDRLATEQALEATQLRLYRNLAEQDAWRQKGKPVPDYLTAEQVTLESKKRRLERRLRRLER